MLWGGNVSVTLQGVDSPECSAAAADTEAPSSCLRCPVLSSEASYVVLLVADNGPPGIIGGLSSAAIVNVTTADESAPTFTAGPDATNISTDSFALRFQLNEAGVVHFVVAYSLMQAQFYSTYLLSFAQQDMTSSQVIQQANDPGGAFGTRPDGIVAAGSILAPAGQAVTYTIAPDCSGSACSVAENVNASMLAPDTQYTVFLVAEDTSGNSAAHNGARLASMNAIHELPVAALYTANAWSSKCPAFVLQVL
jgi:hypothetical protein